MAGEGLLKADFGVIGGAHGDIMGATGKLNQIHSDVTGLMNRLSGTWTEGQARTAWHGYQQQWNTIFADVNQALGSLGGAVDQANQNYQGTESTNASMWP